MKGPPSNVRQDLELQAPTDIHRHEIEAPRNLKQVQNTQSNARQRARLSNDEVYNLVEIGFDSDCIKHFVIHEDIRVFGFHRGVLDMLKNVLGRRDLPAQRLSCDTTFFPGHFYWTVVTFRQTEFLESRTFPVFYMIHELKTQEVHNCFWDQVLKYVPELDTAQRVYIVTDEEKAIVNAIRSRLPGLVMFRCWNHVWQNNKRKLQKDCKISKKEDLRKYKNDVRRLFLQKSENDFFKALSKCKNDWNKVRVNKCAHPSLLIHFGYISLQKFSVYFDDYIVPDRNRIGAWALRKFNLTYITTNQSEALNTVIKRLNEWKKVPMDSMVWALFRLFQSYFIRATFCRYKTGGDYTLRREVAQVYNLERDKPKLEPIPSIEDIVQNIKDARKNFFKVTEKTLKYLKPYL